MKPTGTSSVDLPLDITLGTPAKSLELAHYYAAGDLAANGWYKGTPASYTKQTSANSAGLMTAIHLGNEAKTLIHSDTPFDATNNALWADLTITIKSKAYTGPDGVAYTAAEAATLLNGKKIDVLLERDTGSRAMFFSLGTSAVAAEAVGATSINDTTSAFTLSDLNGSGTVLHFGLYVEGDNSGTVDTGDPANVKGDWKVTISQHS